jgi:hypothetical protein
LELVTLSNIKNEKERHDLALESDWVRDFANDYDFCMVFPAENGTFSEKGKRCIASLRKLDFELFAYRGSKPHLEIFVLVRAPYDKLRAFADNIDFSLKVDPVMAQKLMERGNKEAKIAPVFIRHRPDIVPFAPYEHIHAKYSRSVSEKLYWREPGDDDPFREIIRLKLSALLLETRDHNGSAYFNLRRMTQEGDLLGCYPLHDRAKTQALSHEWHRFPFQRLPLHYIKEYFGEKIAMYFAFMQHFTHYLALPSLVGFPIQIAIWSTNNPSSKI